MASSVPEYLPPLTQKDRNLFINRRVVDKLPNILVTIIQWGSRKNPNQSFEEYLRVNKKLSNRKFKKYFFCPDDLHKLKKNSYESFDCTFLCQLLPLMCNGITEIREWRSIDDSSKIEYHLNLVREIRNAVMHEPETAAVDQGVPKQVEIIGTTLLEVAAQMYIVEADELNKAKIALKDGIIEIKRTVLTEKEKGSLQYEKLIINEGVPNLREKLLKFRESSPFLHHITGFYDLNLTVGNRIIKSSNLLKYCTECPINRIIIIQGQSGSGKSTIVKEMQEDILRNQTEHRRFVDSKAIQIPLFFGCRTLNCRTLPQLISKEFPNLRTKLSDSQLIKESIGQLKSILLVDGIDEMNDDSQALVEGDIFTFLKDNHGAFCVITSRPHSVGSFTSKLDKEGLRYNVLNVEELESEEDQVEFIRTTSEKGADISAAYQRSSLILKLPVLLAMFSYTYHRNPNTVKFWKKEAQIMRAIVEYGLKDTTTRLHNTGQKDCKLIGDHILKGIAFISFCCLMKGKMYLESTDIECLLKKTREECNSPKTSAIDCLSCFFPSIGYSSSSIAMDDMKFSHKSFQEVLAGVYVYQQLKSHQKIETICENAIEEYKRISYAKDMGKFDVRAFLESNSIMIESVFTEFQSAGQLSAYTKELFNLLPTNSGWKGYCFEWAKEILSSYNFNAAIAQVVAGVLPREKKWWLRSVDWLRAAAAILPHQQPSELSAWFDCTTPTAALHKLVAAVRALPYEGKLKMVLWHSRCNFLPCDGLVEQLEGAKCKLTYLRICIEKKESYAALASISTPATVLRIGVARPWNHALTLLQNNFKDLHLWVKYWNCEESGHSVREFVGGQGKLEITIEDIPDDGCGENIARIVICLCVLKIEHLKLTLCCHWSEWAMKNLRQTLLQAGCPARGLGTFNKIGRWWEIECNSAVT